MASSWPEIRLRVDILGRYRILSGPTWRVGSSPLAAWGSQGDWEAVAGRILGVSTAEPRRAREKVSEFVEYLKAISDIFVPSIRDVLASATEE